MGRIASRVYLDAVDIARLQATAQQLPQDQRVQITLDDGNQLFGIVSATPTVQAFFDPDGREGMNALVRIELEGDDHHASGNDCSVWLDQIMALVSLPNPSPPQPSRAWPADPNAPTVD